MTKEALAQVEQRLRSAVPQSGGLISQIATSRAEATRLLMDALHLTQQQPQRVVQVEQAGSSDVRIKLF